LRSITFPDPAPLEAGKNWMPNESEPRPVWSTSRLFLIVAPTASPGMTIPDAFASARVLLATIAPFPAAGVP
jgi:hypothetical protein